jgi:hypothetical protein
VTRLVTHWIGLQCTTRSAVSRMTWWVALAGRRGQRRVDGSPPLQDEGLPAAHQLVHVLQSDVSRVA